MGRTPISHVVYGAQDVKVTAERLRRGLGLEAIPGSRFEDLGLTDWFVPFEDQYIELLTVADEDVAMRTPFGRWVAERTAAVGPLAALQPEVDQARLAHQGLETGVPPHAAEGREPPPVGRRPGCSENALPGFGGRELPGDSCR